MVSWKVKEENVSGRREGSMVSNATGVGLMEHEGKELEMADIDNSSPRDFCLFVLWWDTVDSRWEK